jgi:hypothetical protein
LLQKSAGDGLSWIDLVAILVSTTESRFLICLNRLLQQNRAKPDIPKSVANGSQPTPQ